ncbi:HIT family protein [Limibacter armeniacum]|uniref:HIT family protein n=1 Tax=Limibacter armeniacum TaxID=466084 RepID=UPI002FE650EA
MATIFSKIIAGEIPSYKVYEDDKYLAFLDVFPLKKGHVLLVPKQEVDYMFDMEDEDLAGLYIVAKKLAAAIKKAYPCKKVGQAVIGLEVPHAHLHLVPLNDIGDLNFTSEKLKLAPEEMQEIADNIKQYL